MNKRRFLPVVLASALLTSALRWLTEKTHTESLALGILVGFAMGNVLAPWVNKR